MVAEPLAGTPGNPRDVRTGLDGQFLIAGLPAGSYLITVARRGFAPVQYGQRSWGSAGLPLRLDAKDEASIEIRMLHYGAITGKIIDENGVGIPGHSVAVYREVRPLTLTAQAITDDRGMFRIFGLEPGLYLLRGLTHVYEDATYVPTYYKEALDAGQAGMPIVVDLEADSGPGRHPRHPRLGLQALRLRDRDHRPCPRRSRDPSLGHRQQDRERR